MGHAAAAEQLRMSAADFLAWDDGQTLRHEFVRGEVFLMAGGEDRNTIVAGNLYLALRQHLRGTSCMTLMADVKLRIEAADCFFYPDVMVTCSPRDAADRLIKREPVLVAEVLSPGTAAYDRGDKFADYRLLPSLQEYLLIDPRKRRCDLFRRRADDGLWVLHPVDTDGTLQLASVDLMLPAQALWDELPLDDEPAASPSPAPSAR
jgi:Uma2 family endonuclease